MNVNVGSNVTVNGRSYRFPKAPTVCVCIDGSEPGYIERAIDKGLAPNFARLMRDGANLLARSVIPSFTNPNNLSIITGRPPAVHGIAGNYFFDPATGPGSDDERREVPACADHHEGVPRCRRQGRGGDRQGQAAHAARQRPRFRSGRAIAFSSEKADKATLADNGIDDVPARVGMPVPDVYSSDLSEFVMAAGVSILKRERPDLMYLSTTDYVQHKAAPGSGIANAFYAMMDRYVGELDAAGCVLVLTADHGMNDKHLPNGEPDVIYLQDVFDEWLGKGKARVILPITDPYVAHHGALGSFATVYLPAGVDAAGMATKLSALAGIDLALPRDEACKRFELPPDRIGDIVVLSTMHKVLGTSRARHDLSGLTEPLRSHGGLTEQTVPMIANRKVTLPPDRQLRNFDIFDIALNHVREGAA